jgi:hypothetical protein
MYLLTAAIDWGEVGAIVGILAIFAGIGGAIYTVRKTRLKAKVKASAVRDETGYVEVVVSNEEGTNPITITSVKPVRGKNNVFGSFPFVAKTLGAGETEKWGFDLGHDAPKEVKIRVDTGKKHRIAKPKNVPGVIERDSRPASTG